MSAAPARVLVVDDAKSGRDMLTRRLEQDGHRADVAEDGEQALTMLGAVDYDLVLLDILMPRLDGYGVLERVKADERLRHIPIVVISAIEETASVVRCLQMGADDYVTKPFDAVLLRARVTACLQKKRVHDLEQAHTRELQSLNEVLEQRVTEATEDLRRRVRELTALTEASRAINSVMNTDRLLEQILELSREVMTAEASSLLVLEPETGKLQFVVARGTAGPALKSTTVDLGQGIAGWVAQTGEPLLIADAYRDARFDPSYDQRTGFRTRSILTVPIVIKGEIDRGRAGHQQGERGGVRRARPAPVPVLREHGEHRARERPALRADAAHGRRPARGPGGGAAPGHREGKDGGLRAQGRGGRDRPQPRAEAGAGGQARARHHPLLGPGGLHAPDRAHASPGRGVLPQRVHDGHDPRRGRRRGHRGQVHRRRDHGRVPAR